jgi:CheY-like chemotaxis protein
MDPEGQPGVPRILFCEDDRDTALVVRERLRQAGFAADFAYTAAAAIARAAMTDYAAILVDLQLPDGDGIGVILHLRAQARYHETPIGCDLRRSQPWTRRCEIVQPQCIGLAQQASRFRAPGRGPQDFDRSDFLTHPQSGRMTAAIGEG